GPPRGAAGSRAIDVAGRPSASAIAIAAATTESTVSFAGRPVVALRAAIDRRHSRGRIRSGLVSPLNSVTLSVYPTGTGLTMRILVTGATGNVGRLVVDELLALGATD